MRKIIPVLLLFMLLGACSGNHMEIELYEQAFEHILEENGSFVHEADNISLYIKKPAASHHIMQRIQAHLEKKYHVTVYTYEASEVHVSGPYGKEPLTENGIFIYITELTEKDEKTYFLGEKYYTNKDYQETVINFNIHQTNE